MSEDYIPPVMNPEPISNEPNSSPERDEDHHDAMEVDSGLSVAVDIVADEADEAMTQFPANPTLDLGSTSVTPISTPTPILTPTLASSSREPPAFDEDTERPRQRRRFHVTVEDEPDPEIRPSLSDGANVDDETTVLESAPPRMSELSIATPSVEQPGPMLDVVHDSPAAATASAPAEPISPNQGNQSPHLGTIPLPDVPPPPSTNAPPDPVMEAARRLTSAPNATPDQMQADLALLAPYIAAQAMAAAFPGGGPPVGGGGGNTENAPAPAEGQAPPSNERNNAAPPPVPPFPFLPQFLFGGNTERPPDPKRAERLADGLKVVEDGLLKRWRAVCGEQGAVCAVCYSELLEEPGIDKEKDEQESKDKTEGESEVKEPITGDDHEKALRDALKRREEMERLEKEERERKLETAVLAFPCGHVFHRTCLLPWLSRHTTCPTCRFDIDPKSDTLTVPPDDGMPFPMGPGGFNFRDFFTVGPVLRVPRAQAPGGAVPRTRASRGQTEPDNAPRSEAGGPNAPGGRANNDPPSMTEMFEALFGPLLHSVGIPARPPSDPRVGQTEGARPVPTSIPQPNSPSSSNSEQSSAPTSMPALESDDDEPPPLISDPPASSTASASAPQMPADPPPVPPFRRPAAPRPPEASRSGEDRSQPVAMFGRVTPRRPPQPITPSWMRPSRPAPPPVVTTAGPSSSSSAPEPSPSGANVSAPPTPPSGRPPSDDSSRTGFGPLGTIMSNLLPRRISTSSRASIRSNRSTSSSTSASATRGPSQPNQSPSSSGPGLRAMLQRPALILRNLTSSRRTGNRSRTSTSSTTMPSLESESDEDINFSEDGIQSDLDDDMPGLEPIEGRRPRVQTPTPAQANVDENADDSARETGPDARNNEQARPDARAAGQDMMDNIITLRIDLGHADGRDETIIVPLLFNPAGRPGANTQGGDAQAAQRESTPPPARARTPPPPKKWTPPEPVKTFRQVVEEKEREAGWRCDDPACLLGPADDEELAAEPQIKPRYSIMRPIAPGGLVRHHKSQDGIRVYADGEDVRVSGENPVCDHTLHAECLVTCARVNGWAPPDDADPRSRVTLRCPVCRHEGTVERYVWDSGVESETVDSN
ncbi:Zf-rbx1 domain protein [Ceratobasidium sp. AG-Ba]|nr:Zf-rbx1 domain protein [Ceratobasidium sp. AG-Ba]